MRCLFRGEFTAEAAKSAGFVLAAFATGTPSYVLAKVLQPAYFAREDTKTPMRYTIVSAVVNILLAYPMFLWLGPAGCAFATSIAGWVNLFLLWNGLRLGNQLNVTTRFVTRTVRMIFASAIMGGLIWFLCGYARPWIMTEGNFAVRVAVLAVLVGNWCCDLFCRGDCHTGLFRCRVEVTSAAQLADVTFQGWSSSISFA